MKVGKQVRFSTVPEWLIYGDVSAFAVRVWAVLDRKAESATGACETSISEIARRSRCSVNTAKKAIRELERIGGLRVERERQAASGDPDVNAYTLVVDPSRRDGGGSNGDVPGGSRDDGRVGQTVPEGVGHHVALKTESLRSESHERSLSVSDVPIVTARQSSNGVLSATAEKVFQRFWKAYPKRTAIDAARKAWAKRIKSGIDPETLIAAAAVYGRWCAAGGAESARYIKNPATWLNAGCESDELTDPASMNGRPTGMAAIDAVYAKVRRQVT